MHWKAVIVTLAAALATIAGCSQRTFLNPDDLEKFHQRNYLPLDVDRNPNLGVDPLTEPIPTPSTIDAPERDPRYMTLAESIACSLEKGTTGRQFTSQLGTINEELLRYQPNNGVPLTGTNSDSLRVLSLLPAIEATVIDGNLARFDAKLVGSVNTGTTDQPIQGFNSFNNGDRGSFITSLAKPLPTGGMAAITLSTNYQNLSSPPKNFPLLNPAWTSRGQLTFEQPLWQGSGVEINQILNRIPFFGGLLGQIDPNGSQFVNSHFSNLGQGNFNTSVVTSTGILVARVRYDQSRADFEAAVNFQLVNVEVAYWNLYGAYVNLYSSETALKQAYEAWKISKTRYETGKIRITDYAQTRGQYEQFRGDRMQALGRILEAERILRVLIGLPPTDGKRIVPIDAPTLAPYRPDWDTALKEALTLRPELVAARQQLKVYQFDLIATHNFLKPDLRFISQYGLNGLGSTLAGDSQFLDQATGQFRSTNSLRVMDSAHFADWTLGVVLNVPLGYRAENAAMRHARMQLAQGFLAVQREEQKAAFFLEKAYRDVFESYRLIGARRAQRQAYAEQVEARTKEFIIGEKTIDFLLEAQRQWANALSTEYQAIVAYNNALATFQFAKGTIMQYDTVSIAEGILPQCVAGRATEHERERSTALVLRQLDNPVPHAPPAPVPDELKAMASLPQLSPAEAPRLPALMRGSPKLPANLDELPMPTPTVKAGQPQQLPQALKVASPTMSQMPRSEMPAALPLPKAPQLQQTSHTYKYSAPAASQPSALPTPATVATPAPAVSGNLPLPLPAAATVNKTSGPAWPN